MMTNAEAIQAVVRGERAVTEHTLVAFPNRPDQCIDLRERAVACDHDRDVLECAGCGRQRLVACSFDEDYA